MRLAWLSPWPPDPSGVAGRSAELVSLLARRGHAVDVFVDERRVPVRRLEAGPPRPAAVRVQSAHEFLWRAARGQYDLAVYQIGNSRLHAFIWPYLWHVPGLVVLHDARLHHARGHAWLSRKCAEAYRREFAWNTPDVPDAAAELAIGGFAGTYLYQWPMIRAVVEGSRLVAAHSPGAVAELQAAYPHRPIVHIALGEGRPSAASPADRLRFRRRLGLPDDHVVFGVFGGLTAEKRALPILRVFAALVARGEPVHLLLAGDADPRLELDSSIDALRVRARVTRTGRLDDRAFEEAVAAADVSINLRWPTALEMSGPWLRALAAGRPTIILDLEHLSHLPTLDPRTWHLHAPPPAGHAARDAVAIGIDILDEEHSLLLAMRRLASDPDLRERLGEAGRTHWSAAHTVERMADDYERALSRAATLASPPPLPDPFRPDPLAHARQLAAPFGITRVCS